MFVPAISFFSVCWPLSLDMMCDCCGDQSLQCMLSEASLLCDCHSLVRGRVYPSVVGVEALRSISVLPCEVTGTGELKWGEGPLSITLQELSTGKGSLWWWLSLILWAHKLVLLALPFLNRGNASSQPGSLSGAVLIMSQAQISWCRSTEVWHQDCCSNTSGHALEAME